MGKGRFTATGEYGRHTYDNLKFRYNLLSNDHATPATLPYVGLRFVANISSTPIILWWAFRRDLGTARAADKDDGYWKVGGTAICGRFGFGFDATGDPSTARPAPTGSNLNR